MLGFVKCIITSINTIQRKRGQLTRLDIMRAHPKENVLLKRRPVVRAAGVALGALAMFQAIPAAQDRLKTMPGYNQYEKMARDQVGRARRLLEGSQHLRIRPRRKALPLRRRVTYRLGGGGVRRQ